MNIKDYNFEEHKHRYACWTARCAVRAKKNFTNAKVLKILTEVNIISILSKYKLTINNYLEFHNETAKKIEKQLDKQKMKGKEPKNSYYGIISKLIAIYLKTYFMGNENKILDNIMPPIDSILLKNITKEYNDNGIFFIKDLPLTKEGEKQLKLNKSLKGHIKPWTQYSYKDYEKVYKLFKEHNNKEHNKMWKFEYCWKLD